MDNEFRDRFRSLVDSAPGVEARGSSLPAIERRIARRRPVWAAGLAALVFAVGGAGFVAGEAILRGGTSEAPSDGRLAPAVQGGAEQGQDRAERRVIAAGRRDGREWELRGFRGEGAGGARPLCLEWVQPPVDTGGTACTTDLTEGLPPGEVLVAQTADNPFFGEVAPDVARVEIHAEDGTVTAARVVDAPRALDVPYRFFVGFNNGSGDMTLVALDADGNVLEREVHRALPLLVVTKDGNGAGRVTGYSTDEARCGSECPAPALWIDCGDVCTTELDDATITLEAEPDEGSVFVGWSGACEGTGPCTLTVDSDREVVATFETAP